jgi:hypothetical protein
MHHPIEALETLMRKSPSHGIPLNLGLGGLCPTPHEPGYFVPALDKKRYESLPDQSG